MLIKFCNEHREYTFLQGIDIVCTFFSYFTHAFDGLESPGCKDWEMDGFELCHLAAYLEKLCLTNSLKDLTKGILTLAKKTSLLMQDKIKEQMTFAC